MEKKSQFLRVGAVRVLGIDFCKSARVRQYHDPSHLCQTPPSISKYCSGPYSPENRFRKASQDRRDFSRTKGNHNANTRRACHIHGSKCITGVFRAANTPARFPQPPVATLAPRVQQATPQQPGTLKLRSPPSIPPCSG